MLRLILGIFVLLAAPAWSQQSVFTGRIALDTTISTFDTEKPVAGTLYLLTGAAASIQLLGDAPFAATVEFIEAKWLDDSNLVSSRVLLSFAGDAWADTVVARKPRSGGEAQIYPYRKFQVAAVYEGYVPLGNASVPKFRAVAVPLFF